ncbi:MAG: TetR/AcrR family transcriptional regulator [Acidimicrobiia bacterium]|nr:TetR/AcrR family transcriptional regulator [Acidimicrobiia bacterium]
MARRTPTARSARTTSRRGRPRSGEREERRQRVIDAAFDELLEHGFEHVTMLGIASRAGASKETLYSWFGSRDGLFTAMIEQNADSSAERVAAALAGDADPEVTLIGYATGLLTLLTDRRSVALNRAAMTSPDLAKILLASGRHRVGPIVEQYLARLGAAGWLRIDDPSEAFTLLYGLVVRDTQIRVLLGEPPPSRSAVAARAETGVRNFMALTKP